MEYPQAIPANDPPPADVNVLVQDTELETWWPAKYVPDADNPDYQPDAWYLTGLEDWHGEVTHWMPLPPNKPR